MTTTSTVSFQLDNIPHVDGKLDLAHVEEQLNKDSAWTALPTSVKHGTLLSLQSKVAEALLRHYLPQSGAPIEDYISIQVQGSKPKRQRRKKAAGATQLDLKDDIQ